jgi:endonuclease/exonuclease/phosphatase family metal-dependent hydrolase
VSDLLPGLAYHDSVTEALRHRTEAAFRESELFRRHAGAIDALLDTPVFHRGSAGGKPPPAGASVARTGPSLRVVQWNIEKGKKLDGIKRFLASDPDAGGADIITLNEVDLGMNRSGNADVTAELSAALGMDAVFVPNYIECTKGLPREAGLPGENARGLHGVAILSRLPILAAAVHSLPSCWDYFDFPEKRFGGRRGLYLALDWNGRTVVAATVHIEMRGAPACRAMQFRTFLAGLDRQEAEWGRGSPVIVTGDWNTHTFRRGGRLNSGREFVRIVGTPRARLEGDLVRPYRHEPLFEALKEGRLGMEGVNDGAPTASQALDTVEDLAIFPDWFGRGLVRLSRLEGRVLRMRLDWIAVRGLRAAGKPRTLMPDGEDGEPLSDHALIIADVAPERAGS